MTDSGTTDLRTVAEGLTFLEGPRWHDGALWFSDFYTHRVFRVPDGDGNPEVVCEVPNQPSGLGFDPQGRLLVVSMADCRVLRLEEGELIEHANLSALAQAYCNDMIVMGDGAAYVGNLGHHEGFDDPFAPTRLIRVEPDGSARAVGEEVLFPNGMVVTDDGATLLVAESLSSRVSAFTIAPDGELVDRRVWAQLGPAAAKASLKAALAGEGPAPDGIAIDAEGALWVADSRPDSRGGALRVAPGGDILQTIEVPGMSVFAVALGGTALRTLYLCAAPPPGSFDPVEGREARMLACEVAVPGVGSH